MSAVLLLWAGFAWSVTRPPDPSDYRRTAVQVAGAAHDAAVTGSLIADQQLDGDVVAPFAVTAYEDATRTLAGAVRSFTDEPPPDRSSTALRDRLLPLLADAVRALHDAARASGREELTAARTALVDVGDRLGALVEDYR